MGERNRDRVGPRGKKYLISELAFEDIDAEETNAKGPYSDYSIDVKKGQGGNIPNRPIGM